MKLLQILKPLASAVISVMLGRPLIYFVLRESAKMTKVKWDDNYVELGIAIDSGDPEAIRHAMGAFIVKNSTHVKGNQDLINFIKDTVNRG